MNKKNKYIVILGAGESGCGAALLAQQQGYEVFVSDSNEIGKEYREELKSNGISFEEKGHSPGKILKADEVIKSPGIPDSLELVQRLNKNNIPVISDVEFASRFTESTIIAITGSNGKTTTTRMIYHVLKEGGESVSITGNMGNSMAREVAKRPDVDYMVVEVSSFQLDGIQRFKPHVAVLLNITPDHLDRYDNSMFLYIKSKLRIVENQTGEDYFIFNAEDQNITNNITDKGYMKWVPFAEKKKSLQRLFQKKLASPQWQGAYRSKEKLFVNLNKKQFCMTISDMTVKGKHNTYNSMAAAIVANIFDINDDFIRESLKDFKNLEHRLEFIMKVHGIDFINDSKATNVNSTWYALETMTQPVVWIAGGVDKGNDYSILQPLVKEKVKAIVCLGMDNRNIHEAFAPYVDIIMNTQSALQSVKAAYHLAKEGDAVLLSPACASFDLFENYEDRGRQFKQAVRQL